MRDDLFSETTMSFGEHLDELRVCLWFSMMWLAGGFIVGLWLGGYVVAFIQVPLTKSLETYYINRATKHLTELAPSLSTEGHPSEVATIPQKRKMVPREFWVYPGEIERTLIYKGQTPETPAEIVNVDYTAEPVRILFFQKIAESDQVRTKSLSQHETFSIYIKASFVVGLFLASPGVIYHIWTFIAAGLYPQEKRYVYFFVPFSVILFVGGALFAFFVVFQYVLDFLLLFNDWLNVDPDPRISEWLSFALMLPLGFGISFQLPLVMFVLERIHIFSVADYMAKWRVAVLVIAIASMLLTPSDPWSMLLMFVPLTCLYFVGVALAAFLPRGKRDVE
ncbi:MAG: twin-arginine translocase subunit TatC [Thermoguttaceae bacterium]